MCVCVWTTAFEHNYIDPDVWHARSPSAYLGQVGRSGSKVKVSARLLKRETEVGKASCTALWVKSRPELETVNK